MKALNFLWYLYYRFIFNTCKREKNDAKWSATLGGCKLNCVSKE